MYIHIVAVLTMYVHTYCSSIDHAVACGCAALHSVLLGSQARACELVLILRLEYGQLAMTSESQHNFWTKFLAKSAQFKHILLWFETYLCPNFTGIVKIQKWMKIVSKKKKKKKHPHLDDSCLFFSIERLMSSIIIQYWMILVFNLWRILVSLWRILLRNKL